MTPESTNILIINSGSSSIKFSVFTGGLPLQKVLDGKITRIGLSNCELSYKNYLSDKTGTRKPGTIPAVSFFANWIGEYLDLTTISAVGHRLVHGMTHHEPELITTLLLDELHKFVSFDPEHLPHEIEMIESLRASYPELIQIACFDTAFHHGMPPIAKLLPLPRRFEEMGIHRYGFHGLSYAYLVEELNRVAGRDAANGKVILAHLGNGASLAAVKNGVSIDTSMGFTPASGLVMGTRPGDLDPGLAAFIIESQMMTPSGFREMINHESGLLGISATSSDMGDLLKIRQTDKRASEAIDLFCYQVKKWIGSFAAVLGGLDTLVFTGGIGENAAEIRSLICTGLEFLGIEIDQTRNNENVAIVSTPTGRVTVRVIKTNEELMIAKLVFAKINNTGN